MEEMKLIKELHDEDVGEKTLKISFTKVRTGSRVVLVDDEGKVAVVHASTDDYYKIPGGGVEEEEEILVAAHREAKEESGCEIAITQAVGKIIEYRSQHQFKQINYCYLAKVITTGERELTEKEKMNGFKLVWLTPDEALEKFNSCKTTSYVGKFMNERDKLFLEAALQI